VWEVKTLILHVLLDPFAAQRKKTSSKKFAPLTDRAAFIGQF
jgi:hypothetical protein